LKLIVSCLVLITGLLIQTGAGQTNPPVEPSLEQRQPLELIFADSIVPQDRHEMMLTTGGWYSRQRGDVHNALLTQKIEWGISDKLQISTFVNALRSSNQNGSTSTGMGDFEIGARYTWATVSSPFTHIAVALDGGFPSGSPTKALGEGAYTVSPSLLLSHESVAGNVRRSPQMALSLSWPIGMSVSRMCPIIQSSLTAGSRCTSDTAGLSGNSR